MSANGYFQLVRVRSGFAGAGEAAGHLHGAHFRGPTGGAEHCRRAVRAAALSRVRRGSGQRNALDAVCPGHAGVQPARRLAVYGLQRLQVYLPLNPQALPGGVAGLVVQHGRELRHEYQLAGVRRREHDELSDADGGADGAELRICRDRHRRAAPLDSRLRAPESGHSRQLLGRPHAHHALHPAAAVADPRAGSGVAGRGADLLRLSHHAAGGIGRIRQP